MRMIGNTTKHSISNCMLITLLFVYSLISCKKNDLENTDNQNKETEDEVLIPYDKVPSLSEMIVYEVNFMAFGPEGTLNNVYDRLDSIKSLGINVLWLMPIYPEGQLNGVGSPYCISDYNSINPDIGTLDDLKKFISKAHELEMAVIFDWVANHTSWDNDWISNDSWYVQDGQGNIISPPNTNWTDVAELNYNDQEMRLEMIKAMKFWIEKYNIDGYRCDAVDFVPFSFWKQAMDSLTNIPGRNLILLAESGKNECFTSGFQMNYSWDFQTKLQNIFNKGDDATSLTTIHNAEMGKLPAGASKLRYITNHDIYAWDNSPSIQFVNNYGSVAAFVAAAFMGGVPLIYSGQETGYPSTISFFELDFIDWDYNMEITNLYKSIIHSRIENANLIAFPLRIYSNADVIAFKHSGSKELLVIINARNSTIVFNVHEEIKNTSWKNTLNNNEELQISDSITLNAFEYLILKS